MSEDDKPLEHSARSVADQAQSGTRRVAGNVVGIFAVVGAIAAVLSTYQAFNKDAPDMRADLHVSQSFVPDGSKVALTNQELAIWRQEKLLSESHFCSKSLPGGAINFFRNDDNCKATGQIASKIDRSIKFGDGDVARNTIDLKNNGNDVARSLKLRAPDAGHIKVSDQAGKVLVDRDLSSGDPVSLPDLNPSETLKVVLDLVG